MKVMVDMVSDFVCPWCFLAHRRLGDAIAEFQRLEPGARVQVNYLPFFLDGALPASSRPWRPFLEKKFGGAAALNQMLENVQAAAGEDLHFAFDRIKFRSSTLDAHRLCYRAQSSGQRPERVMALAEALFAAYFIDGRDIGDGAVLIEIIKAVGDKSDTVAEYLEAGDGTQAVRKMATQVQSQGVDSVPFFIFNRRLVVSGAQSVAGFGAALHQVASAHANRRPS